MNLTRRNVLRSLCAPALASWAGLDAPSPGLTYAALDESGSAYRRYVRVWSAYATGQAVDEAEALRLLEEPGVFGERRERHPAAQPLGLFASCTPHRDVFHDFLNWGLRWLTARDSPEPNLPPFHERGQAFAWNWSFWGRAALELYEATGERRFLDLLVGAARNVMAARDDQAGLIDVNQNRVVKSWGAVITFGGPRVRGTDITVTGLVSLPILKAANRLAALGEPHEELARMAWALAPSFDEYESFYVDLPERDAGYYRYAFLPQLVEPTNHMCAFGAGLVELSLLTRDARHLEKARKLLNFWRASCVMDGDGALSSPYEQDAAFRKRPRSEFFWKMTVTAELPLALAEHGLVVTEEEMIGIARTYADVVMADPTGLNALTRRADTARPIDFRKPLESETPEWRSYVPMVAAGLFFVDRERRIGQSLLTFLLHYPQWFPSGLFSGGGVAMLARAHSLRRGFRI